MHQYINDDTTRVQRVTVTPAGDLTHLIRQIAIAGAVGQGATFSRCIDCGAEMQESRAPAKEICRCCLAVYQTCHGSEL